MVGEEAKLLIKLGDYNIPEKQMGRRPARTSDVLLVACLNRVDDFGAFFSPKHHLLGFGFGSRLDWAGQGLRVKMTAGRYSVRSQLNCAQRLSVRSVSSI